MNQKKFSGMRDTLVVSMCVILISGNTVTLSASAATPSPATFKPAAERFEWKYSSDEDELTSKTFQSAALHSHNSLSLKYPYEGPNHGVIIVRQHPRWGLDILVGIKKGQMMCPSYEECVVQVRFDDKAPVTWKAIGSKDGNSSLIFLLNQKRFIAEATKAKRIKISVPFFKNGNQILDFYPRKELIWGKNLK